MVKARETDWWDYRVPEGESYALLEERLQPFIDELSDDEDFVIPEAFSPNGDGQNDVFAPRAIGIDPSQYSLLIYDRWGGLVFESTDLNQPWDGRVQGTTEMAANGIYVWKIVAHDATDESEGHEYNGTVNLIR